MPSVDKQSPPNEDEQKIQEAASLDAETTYEVVRREGLSELDRTTNALFWSGLAGGLSMGFSFLAEGMLRSALPDANWRHLIAKLGYPVGFLIVILGSQQLFTENTLTPIIPLLHEKSAQILRNVLRLWGAVLVANLIGALLFAFMLARTDLLEPSVRQALSDISVETLRPSLGPLLLRALYAGWLIALMVWMLPGAETSKPLVIIVMTYVVGVGTFAHVIVGSSEVFFAAWRGSASWGSVVGGWVLPTLLGNIIGGLTMVAALNYAQADPET